MIDAFDEHQVVEAERGSDIGRCLDLGRERVHGSHREAVTVAADAHLLDTTNLDIDAAFAAAVRLIDDR